MGDWTVLHWEEIQEAPPEPGIYAWYCRLRLLEADVDACIDQIGEAATNGEARESVRDLLSRSIFSLVGETPYRVHLSGPLKPTYAGEVAFRPELGEEFLDELASEPNQLRALSAMLARAVVGFSSPLYIGMSGDIRRRLIQHREVISADRRLGPYVDVPSEWSEEEKSFAHEVRRRSINPASLRVVVQETEAGLNPRITEYLLNRVNFPILGRR